MTSRREAVIDKFSKLITGTETSAVKDVQIIKKVGMEFFIYSHFLVFNLFLLNSGRGISRPKSQNFLYSLTFIR